MPYFQQHIFYLGYLGSVQIIYSCKICYHQYFSVTYFSTFLTSRKLSRLDINTLISTYLSALSKLRATTLSLQEPFSWIVLWQIFFWMFDFKIIILFPYELFTEIFMAAHIHLHYLFHLPLLYHCKNIVISNILKVHIFFCILDLNIIILSLLGFWRKFFQMYIF